MHGMIKIFTTTYLLMQSLRKLLMFTSFLGTLMWTVSMKCFFCGWSPPSMSMASAASSNWPTPVGNSAYVQDIICFAILYGSASSYCRNLVIALVPLRSCCYGNNVCRWVKLQQIIHLSISHSITFRCLFHCIFAIDTEVYWHYGNKQIAAITRCGALHWYL